MPKLSVIIIAKNEEYSIRRTLESIKWADEIVVLDSGSTDQTVAIAKEYTSKVYTTDWRGYGVQKQRALSKATCEWVLNLDADEVVSNELKAQIQNVICADSADAYRVPICMNFYGKNLRYSSSPSRHIRLFKRHEASFDNDIVHEKVSLPVTARISKLTAPIRHYSFRDLSHALYKVNRYSSYSAKIRLEKGKKIGIPKVLLGSMWMFFRCFVVQRGFLDGYAGLVLAILNAQGTLFRGLKVIYPDNEYQDPLISNQKHNSDLVEHAEL